MARFFVRIYDPEGEPHVDREGIDLPDIEAARREAARVLREMACHAGVAEEQRYFAVDVLDQFGNTVVRARMSETVEIVGLALAQPLHATGPMDVLSAAFLGSRTTH